jgi:hypothetical protein
VEEARRVLEALGAGLRDWAAFMKLREHSTILLSTGFTWMVLLMVASLPWLSYYVQGVVPEGPPLAAVVFSFAMVAAALALTIASIASGRRLVESILQSFLSSEEYRRYREALRRVRLLQSLPWAIGFLVAYGLAAPLAGVEVLTYIWLLGLSAGFSGLAVSFGVMERRVAGIGFKELSRAYTVAATISWTSLLLVHLIPYTPILKGFIASAAALVAILMVAWELRRSSTAYLRRVLERL